MDTITIYRNGNLSISAEFNNDLIFTKIMSTTFRNNELIKLCEKYNYSISQSEIFTDIIISEIKGIKNFSEVMNLVIEFRNNLG